MPENQCFACNWSTVCVTVYGFQNCKTLTKQTTLFLLCVCLCLCVNLGQITEGEEKALREEESKREIVKLENCFVMNVLCICTYNTLAWFSTVIFTILLCIKCINVTLCKSLGKDHKLKHTFERMSKYTHICRGWGEQGLIRMPWDHFLHPCPFWILNLMEITLHCRLGFLMSITSH